MLPRDKLSAQVKFQDVANAATRSDGVGEFYTFIRIIRKRITVERCEAAFDRFLVRSTSTCRLSTVRSEIFDMDAVHERSKRYARPYHLVAACSVAVRQNGEPLASCSDSRFSSRLYAVRILSQKNNMGVHAFASPTGKLTCIEHGKRCTLNEDTLRRGKSVLARVKRLRHSGSPAKCASRE